MLKVRLSHAFSLAVFGQGSDSPRFYYYLKKDTIMVSFLYINLLFW
jgi:hypothetical protein